MLRLHLDAFDPVMSNAFRKEDEGMPFVEPRNWRRAVIVTYDHNTSFVLVQNSLEAAEYLLHCWPRRSGKAFRKALKVCADAVEGTASDEDAQRRFIAAAQEAEVAVTIH